MKVKHLLEAIKDYPKEAEVKIFSLSGLEWKIWNIELIEKSGEPEIVKIKIK